MQLCRWCSWPKTSDLERIILHAEGYSKVYWLLLLHVFHGFSHAWTIHWVQSFQWLDPSSRQVRSNSTMGLVKNSAIKILHFYYHHSDVYTIIILLQLWLHEDRWVRKWFPRFLLPSILLVCLHLDVLGKLLFRVLLYGLHTDCLWYWLPSKDWELGRNL